MALQAGIARVDITPPLGVWLTGFGNRTAPAAGVHSNLYAQALALDVDGQRAAIVGLDLIGLDGERTAHIRRLVQDWTGIEAGHVLLNAAHVHAGPSVVPQLMGDLFPVDLAYCDVLARKIASAVKLAADNVRPATAHLGTDSVIIGVNRRERRSDGSMIIGENPEGPIDPTVSALRFDDAAGVTFGLLFAYACHPTIFNGLDISADYVGFARQTVERGLPAAALSVFLQGCGANINPRGRGQSDRPVLAQKLGTLLGTAALKAAAQATPITLGPLSGLTAEVALPLEQPPSLEEAQRIVAGEEGTLAAAQAAHDGGQINRGRSTVAWARRLLACAQEGKRERSEPISVQVLRLGDLAIVALGGEILIEIGQDIQARSSFKPTIVLGYSNGLIGYIPPASAYAEGGYEVNDAYKWYGRTLMFAPTSAQTVADACVGMLGQAGSSAIGA